MILDNLCIKVALFAELWTIRLLLLFLGDWWRKFLPYSRGTLEQQIIGCYWLLNGIANNIPEEARRHYRWQGQFYLFAFFIIIVEQAIDLLKVLRGS